MEITAGAVNDGEKSSKRVDQDDTKRCDRISELPEDILSFVLSFLTVRDAVKTRVLSRKWRYLSASRSKLLFGPLTIFGITYDAKYLKNNSDKLWEGRFRFVKAVDQFMELCRNPKITTFKVFYCLGIEFACHIDRWVSFALKLQAEEIHLNFSTIPQGIELYHFPCHLLPQGKTSTLKYLLLNSCMLRPSPDFVNCFNSLKILTLDRIPLDQGSFNNILSGCINLLRLYLKYCTLPESFSIFGQSRRLQILVLDSCDGAEKIEISAINLTTFEYTGRMTNLSLVGVPSVKKVFLRLKCDSQWGTNDMIKVFAKDLPRLQVLSLAMVAKLVQPIPVNTTIFNHLKVLELAIYFGKNCDLVFVASILNASPCVQQLRLALIGVEFSFTTTGKREYPKQLHYELKEVQMYGVHDRWNVLDLAIYLLKNAAALKRMIVSSERKWTLIDNEKYTDNFTSMSESEKKRVQEVLLQEKVNPRIQLRLAKFILRNLMVICVTSATLEMLLLYNLLKALVHKCNPVIEAGGFPLTRGMLEWSQLWLLQHTISGLLEETCIQGDEFPSLHEVEV